MSFLALLKGHRSLVIVCTCVGLALGVALGAVIYPQGLSRAAIADATQVVYVKETGTSTTLAPDQLAVDLANLGDVDGALGDTTSGIWFQTIVDDPRSITVKVRSSDEQTARSDLATVEGALAKKAVELAGDGASVVAQGDVAVDDGAAALARAHVTFAAYPLLGAFLGFCFSSAALLVRRGMRTGA